MKNDEILKTIERLPIDRRADILKKYQKEIASKETLSLQSLIDYLAINCVLADRTYTYPHGHLLEYCYGVFFRDNSFDIGHASRLQGDYPYLYSEKYIQENKIKGKIQYDDMFLSPIYPPGTSEKECCWYHGYTFKSSNPEDKAFVLPLSKMVVPSMLNLKGGITYIFEETVLSIYQNTNAFLNSNSSFYQDAIVPMTKTLRRK